MSNLSNPWPFGMGSRRGLIILAVLGALFALSVAVDEPLSAWATGWPGPVRSLFAWISQFGQSGWILWPSLVLLIVTGVLGRFSPWPLMRTALRQLAGLYAFFFVGVGLPGLVTNILKNLIGRGRPMHYQDTGLWGLKPSWLDWTYQSFPSGHATTTFALAMVVGFLSARWFVPMLVFAVLVAVSRVTLGVHYPSDVLAGAIVGVLGAYAARWFFAQRGWVFFRTPDGLVGARSFAALSRLVSLRRRGSARARRPGRP